MNQRLTSALAGGVLAASLFVGGFSGTAKAATLEVDVEKNGAEALVDAVGDALDFLDGELLDLDLDVALVELEDSFNNLQALNNVLNNNDIDVNIQDVDIVEDILNDLDIDLQDVLNDLDIDIDDVVGIDILDGGDLLIILD